MIEFVPLAKAELKVGGMHNVGATPRGVRMIAEVSEARFRGERFSAKLAGAAGADWAITRPDGVTEVDVRIPPRWRSSPPTVCTRSRWR